MSTNINIKKKKKKSSFLLLFLSLALGFQAKAGFFAPCSTGQLLYYKVHNTTSGNNKVMVSRSGSEFQSSFCSISGALVIPSVVEHEGITYSVTTITPNAFYGYIGLTSVTIPNSVTSIESDAFRGCSGLTSITFESETPPSFEANSFPWCEDNFVLFVPDESVQDYETALDLVLGPGNGILVLGQHTGVEEHQDNDLFTVYPNPTSDLVSVQLTVNSEQLGKVDIQIFDVFGRLLEVANMADAIDYKDPSALLRRVSSLFVGSGDTFTFATPVVSTYSPVSKN